MNSQLIIEAADRLTGSDPELAKKLFLSLPKEVLRNYYVKELEEIYGERDDLAKLVEALDKVRDSFIGLCLQEEPVSMLLINRDKSIKARIDFRNYLKEAGLQ